MQRNIIYFVFLVLLLILSACKDKYDDCTDRDYANCNTQQPATGRVTLEVTIDDENPVVEIHIYNGNFENNNLVFSTTVSTRSFHYHLDVNNYYSATATYKKGNTTIKAIDGGQMKVTSYRMCELRCYEVNGVTLDLTLK